MRILLPLMIFTASALGAPAQPVAKPVAPAPKTGATPTATMHGKAVTKPGAAPSRALLDLATWLSEKSANLAIKSRTYDPFLRIKDPTMIPPKPVPDPALLATQNNNPDNAPRDPKLVFAEAVAAVNVVMVGAAQFTVEGGATLRQGESFVLTAGETKFNTRVIAVGARAIILENTANSHRVTLQVNVMPAMPAGMNRGGAGSPPPFFRPNPPN